MKKKGNLNKAKKSEQGQTQTKTPILNRMKNWLK